MGQRPDRGTGQNADLRCATLSLRLLETTDLHGHVRAYDYFTDRPAPHRGLSALALEIARARDEARNCLLFDCGDFLQGTPITQIWGEGDPALADAPNPMIAAMNTVGYDAAALGNHEFDFGLAQLDRALAEANFPFVCANLERSPESESPAARGKVTPWRMIEREMQDDAGRMQKMRIAVIGLLPPPTLGWMQKRYTGAMATTCIEQAARHHLAQIRAARPDLVIALAHTGIAPIEPGKHDCACDSEHAALAVAQLDGIDVVLAGHDHRPFPDLGRPATAGIDPITATLAGKPAINAGVAGTTLGVLDLTLERRDGTWQITRHSAALRQVRNGEPRECAAILTASASAHAATLAHIRREIGESAVPLHSYFSMISPDRCLALMARAAFSHAAERLRGHPLAALPRLAAVSTFKAGGLGGAGNFIDIPAGKLRASHLDDLYLFNNGIGAVEITGAELRDWLEQSASVFFQITPGTQAPRLRDPGFASYQFDVISGLRYEIDLSQPPRFAPDGRCIAPEAARIRTLTHAGRPVTPDDRFVLLGNDFRLSGGSGFRQRGRPMNLDPAPVLIRELLQSEIRAANPVLDIAPEPIWRFAPMPGTQVICHTGPGAKPHLHELATHGVHATPLPIDSDGFLPLRIAL
ncbi:5'-nucleotidase C-terminal domain-containing protein [Thioclava pacifica]|uniref:2',3'-cyclic-nucleotide 2'-phosphodiesterase n=1 Tax=Thioclava pacifica DSM 10166 TaxID=1353537 RepID=A0A074JEH5_9RHOB|nr:5'-nucleotidase C-terminal domain-containing protein [Thioclava pacifica]KEO56036.1 hypothetical protein TP2_00520 [Thioclava pacifica DSM 10166]